MKVADLRLMAASALLGAVVALAAPGAHASDPLLPPLVCFIDEDGNVECIDTVFQADTIIDCGGNRDLYAYDGGAGVLSIGYTAVGAYVELERVKYGSRAWQPADSTLLVFVDSAWINGWDFEYCNRYSYFDPTTGRG